MGALDLVRLKEIENVLELFHNSHRFSMTLQILCLRVYSSPFAFFEGLAAYFRQQGIHRVSHSQLALYNILYSYLRQYHPELLPLLAEALKFDYLRTERHRPLLSWMPDKLGKEYKDIWRRLMEHPAVLENLHPGTRAFSTRELAQSVRVAKFSAKFVEFLKAAALPGRLTGDSVVIEEVIGNSSSWVIFDHHRSDPWTKESSYMLVLSE
jgi:hypothetical protein